MQREIVTRILNGRDRGCDLNGSLLRKQSGVGERSKPIDSP
jgi:hypothetical protein